MKKYKTKVDVLHIQKGSVVDFDDNPNKDNRGKTGMLLCTVPGGGSLFFKEADLELVE